MTLFSIRTALVLALAATLASCGGGSSGKATFPVTGSVYNLAYKGLVLQTGSQKLAVAPNVTNGTAAVVPYTFPVKLEYGDPYTVSVAESPPQQVCYIYGNVGITTTVADSAGHRATIYVPFQCDTKTYSLGGAITGLTGAGLQLINGSTDGVLTVAAGATTFTLPTAVQVDKSYGVSVLTQPAGQTCTVSNATGIMPNNAVDATAANPITVSCVNNG